MRFLGAVVCIAGVSWSLSAQAQTAHRPDPMWSDPLVHSSIAVTAVGGLTTIGGTLAWQVEPGTKHCTEFGCYARQIPDERRDIGRTFTGIGIGLTIAGAVGMGATLGAPLEEGEERDGPGAATVGYLMTSLSAGFLGGALALGPDNENRNGWVPTAPLFVASGVFAAVGIPLLVAGAGREDEAERQHEARDERDEEIEQKRAIVRSRAVARGELESRMHSPGMLAVGVGFMTIGAAGAITCAALGSQLDSSGWGGLGRIGYIAGGALSASVALGAGIPLIVIGAKQVPVEEEAPKKKKRSAAAPTRVSVGAGSVTAEWAF